MLITVRYAPCLLRLALDANLTPSISSQVQSTHRFNQLTGSISSRHLLPVEQKFINFIPAQPALGQASGYMHLHDFLNVMPDVIF